MEQRTRLRISCKQWRKKPGGQLIKAGRCGAQRIRDFEDKMGDKISE